MPSVTDPTPGSDGRTLVSDANPAARPARASPEDEPPPSSVKVSANAAGATEQATRAAKTAIMRWRIRWSSFPRRSREGTSYATRPFRSGETSKPRAAVGPGPKIAGRHGQVTEHAEETGMVGQSATARPRELAFRPGNAVSSGRGHDGARFLPADPLPRPRRITVPVVCAKP